jgi:WD40 repeat protein
VATGKERRRFPDPADLRALAFSPDGKVLALGTVDGSVRLWEAEGKELRRLLGHRGPVTCLTFAADGRTLASGSYDTSVLLWNVSGL